MGQRNQQQWAVFVQHEMVDGLKGGDGQAWWKCSPTGVVWTGLGFVLVAEGWSWFR